MPFPGSIVESEPSYPGKEGLINWDKKKRGKKGKKKKKKTNT
jgi:hypothetical protein